MTTANKLIGQALGLIGVRASVEPVGAADATITLERLNTMLDGWRTQSLFAVATTTIAGTLPGGTSSLTIGPSGDLVADPRPIRIEAGSRYTVGGIDHPIHPIGQAEFDLIASKADGALGPDVVFYNATLPSGTLHFYPRAESTVPISLVVLQQVTQFVSLTAEVQLAPGYERAIVFSLAEEVAPDFEREVPPTVARIARTARRNVQRVNHEVPQLSLCGHFGVEGRSFNILNG